MKLVSGKIKQNRGLLRTKFFLKELAMPNLIDIYFYTQRRSKYFLDIQNLAELEADDNIVLILRQKNGAVKILWKDIGFVFYDGNAFPAMIIKTHDLLEMGIDNRREHHEAIWQMVLRHCVGREGVKIDPHWQAYWEAYQQE